MQNDIRVYSKGLAFQDNIYDLRTFETILTSYRAILDRLVSVQLGRKQISKDLRTQLNYNLQINSGSIELLINFALEHKEMVAALYADGGSALSNAIVGLFKDGIILRQKASEMIEKGFPVNIIIKNSFNINSKFNSDNVRLDSNERAILISDPKILFAAQQTRTPVNNLLNQIDGKFVEYIDFESPDAKIHLNEEQKNIVGKQKEELPTTMLLLGRLDMVAFSSHKGAIVSDNERFNVTWDENLRKKLQKLVDVEGVQFKVRPVIDHKRLNNDAIGFHILDCSIPQSTMEF